MQSIIKVISLGLVAVGCVLLAIAGLLAILERWA